MTKAPAVTALPRRAGGGHPFPDEAMADEHAQRQHVWTRYWSSGAAHSCASSYGDRYGGAIADFWRQVQQDTPPGSRLLDVATGSGAIPRLWRSWRTSDTWDAVDLADIAPAWVGDAGPGLRFHAAVSAESLPFAAGSFDLVTSQYGIEYCDKTAAVAEVLRVRAPGGRIALVLHHAGSRPVSLARTELAHLDWALGPDGLIAACAGMLEPVAAATTAPGRERLMRDPAAEAARLRFNAAQVALRERRTATDGADVLEEIRDATGALLQVAMRAGAPRAHADLDAWRSALADHRWRLTELCSHALDAEAAQALAAQIEGAGLRADLGTLSEGQHLMGWTLRARAS